MAKKKPDDAAAEAERRFKADLKAGTLGSFYIICGEEAFLRSHYVELATKKLTDGPAGEFNFHRFSADDCTPQALADAIDAMPMMAERTLVRVDDVDLFKQPEGAREQYAAILSDIPDYCCVLFVYDTVEFKINSTMKKLAAAVKEHAQIVSFGKQSERDLCSWITRHFRAHGKSVTDELCQYLIFRTDGLMTTSRPACSSASSSFCPMPPASSRFTVGLSTPKKAGMVFARQLSARLFMLPWIASLMIFSHPAFANCSMRG